MTDDGRLTIDVFRRAVEMLGKNYLKPRRPLIVCKADAPLLHAELTARPNPGYVLIDEWPRLPTE